MRSLLLPTLLVTLAACDKAPGNDIGSEDLSCEYDPHDWFDNPFYSLLHADEDGGFDFDPFGDSVVDRSGSYGFETGDIEWVNTYADEHPYTVVSGEGYGTVYANGDLDLVTKSVYEDVLGDSWATQVRTAREGCSGTTRISDLDLDAPVDSEPDQWADVYDWQIEITGDDEVTYHLEMDEEYGPYLIDRVATPDLAYQGSFDYADGGYVGTTIYWYDGTGESSWEQYGAKLEMDYDYIGADQTYMDGSRLTAYDIYTAGTSSLQAEVELLWLYDGSATGDYVTYQNGSAIECEVTITAGGESCTMYCMGYGSYDC